MTTRAEIETRVEVMQAWLDGKDIQFKDIYEDKWGDVNGFVPNFTFVRNQYRIKPVEPDYIDWTHVAPRLKFMARDKNGKTYLYEAKPKITHIEFYCNETTRLTVAEDYASFRQGSVDWEDSVVCRPEGV